MDAKELRARTAQYRLRSRSLSDFESDSESIFPSSPSEHRPVSRRRDSTSRNVPPPISNSTPRFMNHALNSWSGWNTDELLQNALDGNWEGSLHPTDLARQQENTASTPTRSSLQPPPSQGFDITTHCNDPSSDEEEESSPQTLADRYQREHMPTPFSPTSDDDAEDALERALRARRLGIPPNHLPSRRRGRRREEPSRIEVVAGETEQSGKAGRLTPHARFFIARDKSVVSVSFDPPV